MSDYWIRRVLMSAESTLSERQKENARREKLDAMDREQRLAQARKWMDKQYAQTWRNLANL